jgi:transposase-like protein
MAKFRHANGRKKGRIPVMRKRYTAQYKAGIVQEILKEEKTVGQIASEQGIHPNQLNRWKAIALEGLEVRPQDWTRNLAMIMKKTR